MGHPGFLHSHVSEARHGAPGTRHPGLFGGDGDAEVGGGGEGLGLGVLALGGAEFVDAGEPELDGEVEAFEVVAEEVGAIGAEPEVLVEVALEGVVVAEVLEFTVGGVDVVEFAVDLFAVFFFSGGLERDGVGVAGGDLVGELVFEADEVDAAGAEVEGVEGVGLAEVGVGGAGLGGEGDGALGVEAEVGEDGADEGGLMLAVGGPWIDPIGEVGGVDFEGGVVEELVGGHEFALGFVDFAGEVSVEDCGVGGLECGDGGFAFVPGGFGPEEDAVPVGAGDGFSVVVPDGVELSGGSQGFALSGELLDVGEGVVPVGIDA